MTKPKNLLAPDSIETLSLTREEWKIIDKKKGGKSNNNNSKGGGGGGGGGGDKSGYKKPRTRRPNRKKPSSQVIWNDINLFWSRMTPWQRSTQMALAGKGTW